MPLFKFQSKNPNGYIELITVDNDVTTCYYSMRKIIDFKNKYNIDLHTFTIKVNGDGEQFTFIKLNDSKHKHLHDGLPAMTKDIFHHHIGYPRAITLFDLWYYVNGQREIYKKYSLISGTELTYFSMDEAQSLLVSFAAYTGKFKEIKSYQFTANGLEISYNAKKIKRFDYLERLRTIIGDESISYNKKTNRYCLASSWLNALSQNAKEELSQNLNIRMKI